MTYQALSLTMTLNDLQKLLFELLDTLDRQCFEKKNTPCIISEAIGYHR